MSEYRDDDFLRKIAENPADDMPRLAYCDWLEEKGNSGLASALRMRHERSVFESLIGRKVENVETNFDDYLVIRTREGPICYQAEAD